MVLFSSESSVVAARAQKQEQQQQQQQIVGAVWYPDFVFMMRVSTILLCWPQFHCFLDLILICPYFKSTEVKTSSEHCNRDNIWRWVWFIYWFFSYFSPYYFFVLFVLTCYYIVIIIVLRCVPCMYLIYTEVKLLSEHSNSDNNRR